MSLLMDNVRRTIDLIEQTKVETVIQLYEMGYVNDDKGKKFIIIDIFNKMGFTTEQINSYIAEYQL